MMSQLRYYLTDMRFYVGIALIVIVLLFLFGADTLKMIAFWLAVVLVAALLIWLLVWLVKKVRARKASSGLSDVLTDSDAGGNPRHSKNPEDANMEAMSKRMQEVVKSIKTSRIGQTRGTEALYELPWYMIIGNPAAGKSTAIINSGLNFPFSDEQGSVIRGIGGTRNCDWYFTSEGILIDTAGRYSVEDENRSEWLGVLDMLRKHRPRAPINGIIIAASVAELTGNRPEFAIDLAKKLRRRVQELTDWLEVVAPVYVVFTKADLISGFEDFFNGLDEDERNRVWGSTLPFHAEGEQDIAAEFDRYFDELSEGLREMSLSQLALNRGREFGPGLLTLPLEFAGIKSSLQTFVATLFEENPYQYRPVFRGFYFTSALQEAASVRGASDQIAKQFHLDAPKEDAPASLGSESAHSYFLLDLFRKVMFADKQLVRQYSSRNRRRTRYGILIASALILGVVMGGWAWSYTNNRQLVNNVQADLEQVDAVQAGRVDLESRLQALGILQDRLQQLQAYRNDHPLMLGLGLYQGEAIEAKLRAEYFHGMQQIMLKPVVSRMETYLNTVLDHSDSLAEATANRVDGDTELQGVTYKQPSPTSTRDAYNALRAYLMLGHPEHVQPIQLSSELTRFWRQWLQENRGVMGEEELISRAQKLMTFYVAQFKQPGWPTVDNKVTLVQGTRIALRQVMRGMSAIERVYAQVKARAATRFPAISVASILGNPKTGVLLTGSYAVPGTFTREAWQGYVQDSFKHAANHELSSKDWVLMSTATTDLTLTGSPEQIQKRLTTMYNQEYVKHWKKFLKSINVTDLGGFSTAVAGMNRLGDPQNSPLRSLMDEIYAQTTWDNPKLVVTAKTADGGGFSDWFKRVILQRSSYGSEAENAMGHLKSGNESDAQGGPRVGPIGQHFAGLTQMMKSLSGNPSLFDRYMSMLGTLRTKLHAIGMRSDAGPGASKLMAATLKGENSELSAGLKLVDEQMLNGLDSSQRNTLRPLLLRPLMQTFKALIAPAEVEINKTWNAQVYQPYMADLARKYPFDPHGQIQATDQEIAQIFGPSGAIANFASKTLAPLANQRGSTLTAKQWAAMGIVLSPQLMANFHRWVAPLGQTSGAAQNSQIVFQVLPEPARNGIVGYSLQVNDQTLRYRNTPPRWTSMVWSGGLVMPVVKLSVTTLDGRNVVLEQFSGDKAMAKLFGQAVREQDPQSKNWKLTWKNNQYSVSLRLKIVSSPNVNADGTMKQGLAGTRLPVDVVGSTTPVVTNSAAQDAENNS